MICEVNYVAAFNFINITNTSFFIYIQLPLVLVLWDSLWQVTRSNMSSSKLIFLSIIFLINIVYVWSFKQGNLSYCTLKIGDFNLRKKLIPAPSSCFWNVFFLFIDLKRFFFMKGCFLIFKFLNVPSICHASGSEPLCFLSPLLSFSSAKFYDNL